MNFLVIGGAGYIGSHFVREALRQNHHVTVMDNLSRGHRSSVAPTVPFIKADLLDQKALAKVLKDQKFEAIFHFAAFALVGESVSEPGLYYENNSEGVRILLDAMKHYQPKTAMIFSSSCAVFGVPENLPIAEGDAKNPISPYGRSKLVAEWMLEDFSKAYGLKTMALRYFNACGADPDGGIGEDHVPETHLIPNILLSALKKDAITIFGQDFPTRDGSCVRDYIHVTDLADAHIKAAEFLLKQKDGTFETLHLGTGEGYSNFEILQAAQKVVGQTIDYKLGPRRAGDPPELYADTRKMKGLLGFKPRYSELKSIIETAWEWHKTHPKGYSI